MDTWYIHINTIHDRLHVPVTYVARLTDPIESGVESIVLWLGKKVCAFTQNTKQPGCTIGHSVLMHNRLLCRSFIPRVDRIPQVS